MFSSTVALRLLYMEKEETLYLLVMDIVHSFLFIYLFVLKAEHLLNISHGLDIV